VRGRLADERKFSETSITSVTSLPDDSGLVSIKVGRFNRPSSIFFSGIARMGRAAPKGRGNTWPPPLLKNNLNYGINKMATKRALRALEIMRQKQKAVKAAENPLAGVDQATIDKVKKAIGSDRASGDFYDLMRQHHDQHNCSWLEAYHQTVRQFPDKFAEFQRKGRTK
jgi:hypothetical protein